MKIVLIATLFMFAAGLGVAQQPAPVKVEQDLLQGASEDGLTIYRGIPFAAPPVGDLRWRAPQCWKPDSAAASACASCC
jgi:para-nitrobenzyl esterase